MINFAALNRRETYSGSMVIFTGVYYLVMLFNTSFHPGTLITDVSYISAVSRLLFLVILYFGGSLLFFNVHPAGWYIAAATLLNLVLVISLFTTTLLKSGILNNYTAIAMAFTILVLMSFLFLFGKQTRIKFIVNNKSYLLTLGLFILLRAITVLL